MAIDGHRSITFSALDELPRTSGIYVIRNVVSGKVYVGSSGNIQRRLKEHLKSLRAGTHKNHYLLRAWQKHGEDRFEIEVLDKTLTSAAALQQEALWIIRLQARDKAFGYNLQACDGTCPDPEVTFQAALQRLEPVRDCLLWSGPVDDTGAGFVTVDRKKTQARRFFYERYHGVQLARAELVDVSCGNSSCLRREHLCLTSRSELTKAAVVEGRLALPSRKAVGSASGRARLTEDKVRELRALFRAGSHTISELARMYDIARGTLRAILSGKTWSHVGEV